MSKLVTIVGNSGSGKTTLARRLGEEGGWLVYLETHEERPFQAAYAADRRFALPNQIDYLLFRAEQERMIRQSGGVGIQDGGLDLDFHLFTHLFYRRGDLSRTELELCTRLYHTLRSLLPAPELVICLTAPLETIASRKASRQRTLDISLVAELGEMQTLLDAWLDSLEADRLVRVASDHTLQTETGLQRLINRIQQL